MLRMKRMQQLTNSREAATISRLERKSNPYGKMELDEISHRSYSSPIIRKFCEKWEPGQEIVEELNDDITEALEGFKPEFPRLHL